MQDDDWEVIPGSIREKVILATDDETIKGQMAQDQWDLYSPTEDIEDEAWMRENRPGAGEMVLSCPGCFTPVAYQFEEHEKFEGQYRCKDVWGCELGPELETSSGDHFLQLVCSECRSEIGLWEFATGKYHLFHVLPGFG